MNRKTRRAGLKSPKFSINIALADDRGDAVTAAHLITQARGYRERGQPDQAQDICNGILAREPSHILALNLLGLILQESGRHRLAVKTLTKAIAADALNAACHYNIAASYQAPNLETDAAVHRSLSE